MEDYISENSEEKSTRIESRLVGDTDENSKDFENPEFTWYKGSLSLPCYSVLCE